MSPTEPAQTAPAAQASGVQDPPSQPAATPQTEIKGVASPEVTSGAQADAANATEVDEIDLRTTDAVPADEETAAAVADAQAHLESNGRDGSVATPEEIASTYASPQALNNLQAQNAYRIPNEQVAQQIERVRQDIFDLEVLINTVVPEGRERQMALARLDEARMWALNGLTLNSPIKKLPVIHRKSLST